MIDDDNYDYDYDDGDNDDGNDGGIFVSHKLEESWNVFRFFLTHWHKYRMLNENLSLN